MGFWLKDNNDDEEMRRMVEDLKRRFEEANKEFEATDHWQVRVESIRRLKVHLGAAIHPSLVAFAIEAGWLRVLEGNLLSNFHSTEAFQNHEILVIPGSPKNKPVCKRVLEIHRMILAAWEKDME